MLLWSYRSEIWQAFDRLIYTLDAPPIKHCQFARKWLTNNIDNITCHKSHSGLWISFNSFNLLNSTLSRPILRWSRLPEFQSYVFSRNTIFITKYNSPMPETGQQWFRSWKLPNELFVRLIDICNNCEKSHIRNFYSSVWRFIYDCTHVIIRGYCLFMLWLKEIMYHRPMHYVISSHIRSINQVRKTSANRPLI